MGGPDGTAPVHRLASWGLAGFHGALAVAFLLAWTRPAILGADRLVDLYLVAGFELMAGFLTFLFLHLFHRKRSERLSAGVLMVVMGVPMLVAAALAAASVGRVYLSALFPVQLAAHWVPLAPRMSRKGPEAGLDPKRWAAMGVAGLFFLVMDLVPLPALGLASFDPLPDHTGLGPLDFFPFPSFQAAFLWGALFVGTLAWVEVRELRGNHPLPSRGRGEGPPRDAGVTFKVVDDPP